MAQLPSEVLSFFSRTQTGLSPLVRPWWLKSAVHESVWRVETGKRDLRQVGEKSRGGQVLRWDLLLPTGRLSTSSHAVICEQCKALIIAVAKVRGSTRSLRSVHGALFLFAEFLALKYEEKFLRDGLLVAHLDDVEAFMESYAEAGSCGTGRFIERLSSYLSAEIPLERLDADEVRNHFGLTETNQLSLVAIGAAISVDWQRLRSSPAFRSHLTQYGYRGERDLSRGARTTSGYADIFPLLAQASHSVQSLSAWALSNVREVRDACRPFRREQSGRTATLPPTVCRQFVRSACAWMLEEAPALEAHLAGLIDEIAQSGDLGHRSPTALLKDAEALIETGPLVRCSRFVSQRFRERGDDRYCDLEPYRLFPLVLGLIRIHLGVCFGLVALFACARRSEIIDMGLHALLTSDGRYHLTIHQAKRGEGNERPRFDKPVPRIVAMAISIMNNLRTQLLRVMPREDALLDDRVMFFVGMQGIRPFSENHPRVVLQLISDYFDLRGPDGKRWVLEPHQLRRSFAMTFFHSEGEESSLPALAWLMGHHDVEETWRYVKESMTGKEISHAEACLAMAAVNSGDGSESAQKLKTLLLEHFGSDDLAVLDHDDVLEYLEMLSEERKISVKPIQITTGDRSTFTILISHRGE
ncbi:MAG TPA: hypothetical protein DIC54_00185 [Pseudomonas sp.]|nr:hypothetical protein [Pseudomonas sp.]